MEEYGSSFSTGMKIEIRIPVPCAKPFCDWAVISTLQGDQISLQLSRDILPEGVSLRVGQVVECRNVNDARGRSHRAIVVGKGFAQELQLRLIGEIASDEQREFFRVDVFLPVAYRRSSIQSLFGLQRQWQLKRRERTADENARKKKHKEDHSRRLKLRRTAPADPAEACTHLDHGDSPGPVLHDESWNAVIPRAINICGGGMSLVIDQAYAVDEFVLLEILIPSSGRVVDIVARVIFANRVSSAGGSHPCYNSGMQFAFIDEGDRAAIVNYIAQIQLQRLRLMQGFTDTPLYDPEKNAISDARSISSNEAGDNRVPPAFQWQSVMMVLGALIVCSIGVMFVLLLVASLNGTFSEFGMNIGNSLNSIRAK